MRHREEICVSSSFSLFLHCLSVHRDLPQMPTPEVQSCVNWLAHLVVRIQEEGSYISPWSLMACLLLQMPTTDLTEAGLLWDQLTEKTLWLKRLALTFGAHLNWPGGILYIFITQYLLFFN